MGGYVAVNEDRNVNAGRLACDLPDYLPNEGAGPECPPVPPVTTLLPCVIERIPSRVSAFYPSKQLTSDQSLRSIYALLVLHVGATFQTGGQHPVVGFKGPRCLFVPICA